MFCIFITLQSMVDTELQASRNEIVKLQNLVQNLQQNPPNGQQELQVIFTLETHDCRILQCGQAIQKSPIIVQLFY